MHHLVTLLESTPDACKHLLGLILTPTRELALQITQHLRALARFTDVKVEPIVGGMSIQKQHRLLSRNPEIVVATPGCNLYRSNI